MHHPWVLLIQINIFLLHISIRRQFIKNSYHFTSSSNDLLKIQLCVLDEDVKLEFFLFKKPPTTISFESISSLVPSHSTTTTAAINSGIFFLCLSYHKNIEQKLTFSHSFGIHKAPFPKKKTTTYVRRNDTLIETAPQSY